MISETFNYTNLERANLLTKKIMSDAFPDFIGRHLNRELPPKIGSFQQFVHGYRDASYYLEKFKSNPLPSGIVRDKFQAEFEKLVILDYIIRNTDRNSDNWLIRITSASDKNSLSSTDDEQELEPSLTEWTEESDLIVTIAAIDNGLAFPYKHPDAWRSYPFHWSILPNAHVPFSENSRQHFLRSLKDIRYIEQLVDSLYLIFKNDKRFIKPDFERQMAVMRGQMTNLVYALENNLTPRELTELPPAYLHSVKTSELEETSYIHEIEKNPPFFRRF